MNIRPVEHRALLLKAMQDVMDGKISPQGAQSVALLSNEIHKSIDQEWNMRVYMHESCREIEHRPTKMLEAYDVEAS